MCRGVHASGSLKRVLLTPSSASCAVTADINVLD